MLMAINLEDALYYRAVFFVFVIFLGLIMGSFANVVIYRFLSNESVIDPLWSRCPGCQKIIKWYDNIPVLSWLLLRGKCRHCGTSVSIQYPLVELLVAILFVFNFQKFGINFSFWEYSLYAWILVVVSFIDIKSYLLPDIFTVFGILAGFMGSFINPQRDWLDSAIGIVLGGGLFWFLSFVYFYFKKQVGLGGGDIKLLAMIGAFLGWKALPLVILIASITGSVAGLLAMRKSTKGLKTMIPFGPFLAIGGLI
ncbi:MAG: prepilin peptidase, partial [Bdellovibrionaceae bacterium]|nr:prepilin peptidase [Pseudobdellovibrionaceae bacterium]